MEVAGFVLGVYPEVCVLLDQHRKGAKYVKNYRQFLQKYTSFITDISFQQLKFEELLYDLMCSGPEPYLTGSISHRQFLDIVRSKDYKGWNDPQLYKMLEIRLDNSYSFALKRLNEILRTFEELERLLQIQEYHGSTETADSWQFQWQRAKQTWFQPTYLEKCRKMGDQIDQIKQRVTSRDQRREREMGSNTDSFGSVWLTAFENATSLYNVLKTAWRCRCSLTHKTLLNLRSLIAESSRQREQGIDLIFTLSSSSPIDNQNLTASPQGSKEWEVFLKNRVSTRAATSLSLHRSSLPAIATMGSLIQASIPAPTDLSISGAGKTTNPSTLSATDAVSVRISIMSGGKESTRGQGGINGSESFSIPSKTDSQQSHIRALVSKFSRFRSSNKSSDNLTSSARSPNISSHTIPKPFNDQEHVLPSTPWASSPQNLPESVSVSSALDARGSSETTLSTPASAGPLNTGSSTDMADTEVIPDLCKALWMSKGTSCLGYLGNEHDSHNCLQLFCKSSSTVTAAGSKSTRTLKDLLALSPGIFPRSEGALVALTLAKAILQLHTTQWVDENWTKEDVLFRTQGSSVVFEDVYFTREFPSFASTSSLLSPSPNGGAPATDEEQQDSSRAQVAAKIVRLCNSLECLGIVLVELCLGAPLESLDGYILLQGGKGKSTDLPEHATLCKFAKELSTLDMVSSNEPQYYETVKCCFWPRNLDTALNRCYEDVMEDLYNEIVPPLLKINQN